MKRSIQEIIELLVFGLIALLIGTGLLWVVGWAFGGIGFLLKFLAGLIWSLLRFVVPIAVVGAAVYALVRLLQGQRDEKASSSVTATGGPASSSTSSTTTVSSPARDSPARDSSKPASAPPPAEATSTKATEPETKRAAVVEEELADDGKRSDASGPVSVQEPREHDHESDEHEHGHESDKHEHESGEHEADVHTEHDEGEATRDDDVDEDERR